MLGLMLMVFFLLNSIDIMCEKKELNTKHFKIIFDEKLEEHVKILKERADELAEKEFEFFGYTPSFKINIIVDESCIENAFALLPFASIFLYPNLIFQEEKNYKNWMEHLLVHELSHILLGLKLHGPYVKNPESEEENITNAYISQWLHEGLSVYLESRLLEGGRVNSRKFNKIIRSEVKSSFRGLSLAGPFFPIEGYKGNGYTHGSSFISYYISKFGESKFREALNLMARTPYGASVELNIFATTVEKKEEELIEDWKNHLLSESHFDTSKLVEGEEVFGGDNSHLTKDEDYIYFGKSIKGIEKDIYRMGSNEKPQLIKKGIPTNYFSVFNAKVCWSKFYQRTFGDAISHFSPPFGVAVYEEGNLIDYKNVVRACNTPRGYVYIERKYGFEKLKDKDGETLIDGLNFGNCFYHDEKLFFDGSRPGHIGNFIYEYSFTTKKLRKVVEGIDPFVENGYLYFAQSKDGGVYNICRKKIDGSEIEQLTNVEYDASRPVMLKGELFYLNYKEGGDNIYKIKNIVPFAKFQNSIEEKEEPPLIPENKSERIGDRYSNSLCLGHKKAFSKAPLGYISLGRHIFLDELLNHNLLIKFNVKHFSFKESFLSNLQKFLYPSIEVSYLYRNQFRFSFEYNMPLIKHIIGPSNQTTEDLAKELLLKSNALFGNKFTFISSAINLPIFIKKGNINLFMQGGFFLLLNGDGVVFADFKASKDFFLETEFSIIQFASFERRLKARVQKNGFGISYMEKPQFRQNFPAFLRWKTKSRYSYSGKKWEAAAFYKNNIKRPVLYGTIDGILVLESWNFNYIGSFIHSNYHSPTIIFDGNFSVRLFLSYNFGMDLVFGLETRILGDRKLGSEDKSRGRFRPYLSFDINHKLP